MALNGGGDLRAKGLEQIKVALAFDYTHINEEVQQLADAKAAKMKSMGSIAARAAFRHHSQSERVGQVVFGQDAMMVAGEGDDMAKAVTEDDRLNDASYLRGTMTMHNESHFKSAAGLSSPTSSGEAAASTPAAAASGAAPGASHLAGSGVDGALRDDVCAGRWRSSSK